MAGPLHGIRVVDVTTNISGPSLTMILADLGAEVIKIERPNRGDDSRMMGPLWEGEGVYYLNINRNKRSIVINLQEEEGKHVVYNFVKDADVFVENFRYGKAEKLGFGYDKLNKLNSKLIYCSLSAYGQKGEKKYKPGYDAIIQADTGIMGINGSEKAGPARAAVSILDQGSAMWGAIGIISALYERKKTGKGQKVTTSLYETGVFWMGYHMLAYMATKTEPKKMGSNHAAFAPYGAFETSDDPIMIGVSNDSLFEKVCRVIQKEEWITDDRFCTNIKRVKNRTELNELLENQFKTNSSAYWLEKFDKEGVPCSIIQNVSSVLQDKQLESLEMLASANHPKISDLKLPRLPIRLSNSTLEIKKSPPLLGEDTVQILKEHGINDEHIQILLNKGIIQ
ncbi:CaiB/BaiF CoA transferase family protein [Pueribacillus sp. YX66]|uniref:CaiB/BaiF CoA transferase family protein n=1 Tax=Pueribacillus sp. YX66 TaxID=3229242 RepID=UPI00358D82EE